MYEIVFTKQAVKDAKKINQAQLKSKVLKILETMKENPYKPPYEKLQGDLKEFYLRRINIQHRIVCQIYEKDKTIKIIRMWTHYE